MRDRIAEVCALPEGQVIPPEYMETDRDLHLLIARSSTNPVLLQLIQDLRKRTAMVRFGRLPSHRNTVCEEHLTIIDAIESGDADAAQEAMRYHIDQVRNVVLRRLGGER